MMANWKNRMPLVVGVVLLVVALIVMTHSEPAQVQRGGPPGFGQRV